MSTNFADRLDGLAAWRGGLGRSLAGLEQALLEQDLADAAERTQITALRERLDSDRLLLAVVAEFARGKSELINAILFAETGHRLLPARPGRTTMCPVEIYCDAAEPTQLSLLPIETRLQGLGLAELRGRDEPWQRVPLDAADPAAVAQTLLALTRTLPVSIERARALGFWHDDAPQDNPLPDGEGLVRVPAWRHALINHPHPLLRRGLVVLDTPGLNAVGCEPELALSLLPAAQACVFVLGADTGVTQSDLALWSGQLLGRSIELFVVLNKLDALADPLATAAELQARVEVQRELTAQTLGLPLARVFALSARDALAARIDGDRQMLARSRLPEFEDALAAELLPRRAELLATAAVDLQQTLRAAVLRRLADRHRQQAELLLDLRSLRGKSGARRRVLQQRIASESADFERCSARLTALRAVQQRLLIEALAPLATDLLRGEIAAMLPLPGALALPGALRKSFAALCEKLRDRFAQVGRGADELRQLLEAGFAQLNVEFGFACVLPPQPVLARQLESLALIESGCARYFGWSQAWRISSPGFGEQFRRMLLSRLRVVFDNAAGEIEHWSKSAGAQVELQLRERRRGFARRREALERIDAAGAELEVHIAELETQEAGLQALQRRVDFLADAVVAAAQVPLAPTAEPAAQCEPA